ncbi:MAG: nucleotide exchange factor GrpE [Thermoplasmata archaeon]|nr:nucleotide exchange factor GrpE [Thermoplasmata archaeon]
MPNKKKTKNQKTGGTEPSKESEILLRNEQLLREVEDIKRQLAEKTELSQGYFAQLQRGQADFENYRKRIESEKARIADSACETLVAGLLDTLDNFERAIEHLEKLPDEESRGVLMIYKNMLEYLQTNGLERIAAAGCQFDPRKHEAIMQAESGKEDDGRILDEFQSGYAMKGKVIRPAKVKVARHTENKDDDTNIKKEE